MAFGDPPDQPRGLGVSGGRCDARLGVRLERSVECGPRRVGPDLADLAGRTGSWGAVSDRPRPPIQPTHPEANLPIVDFALADLAAHARPNSPRNDGVMRPSWTDPGTS